MSILKIGPKELIDKSHLIIKSNHRTSEFFSDLLQTITKGETWQGNKNKIFTDKGKNSTK